MRRRRTRCVLVAATLTLLATSAGCGGTHATTHEEAASAEPSATTAALPSAAELTTYFDAVASYRPSQLADAARVATPKSPAADYLDYLSVFAESASQGNHPVPPSTVTRVGAGFRACGGTGSSSDCVTWADLQGHGGRLSDFTVNDQLLDANLVALADFGTGHQPIEVTPRFAYRSPQSGTLDVLATVKSANPLTLDPTQATYQDQLGRQPALTGVRGLGPTALSAGRSNTVTLAFADAQAAPLNGEVEFRLVPPSGQPVVEGFSLTPA